MVGRGLVSNSLQEGGGDEERLHFSTPDTSVWQILWITWAGDQFRGLVLTYAVYADCKCNLMVSVHKVCAYTSTLMRFTSRLLQQLYKTSNGGLANCPFNLLQAEEKDEEKTVAQIKHPLST